MRETPALHPNGRDKRMSLCGPSPLCLMKTSAYQSLPNKEPQLDYKQALTMADTGGSVTLIFYRIEFPWQEPFLNLLAAAAQLSSFTHVEIAIGALLHKAPHPLSTTAPTPPVPLRRRGRPYGADVQRCARVQRQRGRCGALLKGATLKVQTAFRTLRVLGHTVSGTPCPLWRRAPAPFPTVSWTCCNSCGSCLAALSFSPRAGGAHFSHRAQPTGAPHPIIALHAQVSW